VEKEGRSAARNGSVDSATDDKKLPDIKVAMPEMDIRTQISMYGRVMDEIFRRMNIAIKLKGLDPMDLKLLPNSAKLRRRQVKQKPLGQNIPGSSKTDGIATTTKSILILTQYPTTTTTTTTTKRPRPRPPVAAIVAEDEEEEEASVHGQIRGWLFGMSTLARSDDVSLFPDYIQCPFTLGPLELKVSRTIGFGRFQRTK